MVELVKEKQEESQTSVYIRYIVERIIPLVEQRDKKRVELRNVLFDDNQKSELVESYKAIAIIEKIHLAHKDDPELFFKELREKKELIGKFDSELLNMINRIGGVHGVDPLIQKIYAIFTTYPRKRVFEHFRAYYDSYSKRLEVLGNQGAAIKDMIRKFLLVYDERKTKKLSLLRDILRRISVGEEEATWKDFLNVYSNMGKIIKALKVRYFDDRTAKELLNCLNDERHYGQQPEAWKRKFKEIIYRLQQEDIIEKVLEKETDGIVEGIRNVITNVKKIPRKVMSNILVGVKKKKKSADKIIMNKRKAYIKEEDKSFIIVMAFKEVIDKFVNKLDVDNFVKVAGRLQGNNNKLTTSMVDMSRRFTGSYPGYDAAVSGRLIGLAAGIRANDDRMLDSAVGIRRGTLGRYTEVKGKGAAAIKVLDNLIVFLSNLIERGKKNG